MDKYFKIGILCMVIVVLSLAQASGRGAHISRHEISALEKSGRLIPVGNDEWKTRGGLIIRGRDPKGLTRLDHIMRHASDIPSRKKHGVFTISKEQIIDLMDETWRRIQSGELRGQERAGRVAYTYTTGKKIGYMGGKEGTKRGHPDINSVRIVLKKTAPEVITFFPY